MRPASLRDRRTVRSGLPRNPCAIRVVARLQPRRCLGTHVGVPSAVPQNPLEASGAPDAADRSEERNGAAGSAAGPGAAAPLDAPRAEPGAAGSAAGPGAAAPLDAPRADL